MKEYKNRIEKNVGKMENEKIKEKKKNSHEHELFK